MNPADMDRETGPVPEHESDPKEGVGARLEAWCRMMRADGGELDALRLQLAELAAEARRLRDDVRHLLPYAETEIPELAGALQHATAVGDLDDLIALLELCARWVSAPELEPVHRLCVLRRPDGYHTARIVMQRGALVLTQHGSMSGGLGLVVDLTSGECLTPGFVEYQLYATCQSSAELVDALSVARMRGGA